MSNGVMNTQQDYDKKAKDNNNETQREQKSTFQVLCFNNWVKSVLINIYSKQMCRTLETILDIRKGDRNPLLHVLDVGCGRGQDVKKWKLARVRYMLATDFSEECIKKYEERWRVVHQPFRLQTVCADFCSPYFYNSIQHTSYDIVSAQLCFHYMFKNKQNLQNGLASILSNLLVDGVFIATIPDSYSIMRKIKESGRQQNGYTYYGNQYFSIRFAQTTFTQSFGNQYGFYLQDAVGEKDKQTGQIKYNNEYLVELDSLDKLLGKQGVRIEYTDNFLDFYKKYKDEYKDLLRKLFERINYQPGESMKEELWEIAHLYRVLVCRKISAGKRLSQFKLDDRIKSIKGKQIYRKQQSNHHYGGNRDYNNKYRGRGHQSNDKYRHNK